MRDNGSIHSNHLTDQRQAELNMAAHGIKAPKPCECDPGCFDTDYDGMTSCIYCGRAPKRRTA